MFLMMIMIDRDSLVIMVEVEWKDLEMKIIGEWDRGGWVISWFRSLFC